MCVTDQWVIIIIITAIIHIIIIMANAKKSLRCGCSLGNADLNSTNKDIAENNLYRDFRNLDQI